MVGEGINKMIDGIITKYDELPALPNKRRMLFCTVALVERRKWLLTQHIQTLRAAFRMVKVVHSFTIGAIVILPDYLRCIWTLPEGDDDFFWLGKWETR